MSEPVFRGVAVALVTLFTPEGVVDEAATADHAVRLVELGVSAVVVAGSTGEAASLTPDERSGLLAAVREAVPPGTPVIAGTGAAWSGAAVALTAAAVEDGADAVLVLSPPFAADPRHYYDEVVKVAGALPVLAYHFPDVSPPGVPVEVLADLPVAGLKDSSGDADRLLAELDAWDRPVYLGSSALLAHGAALGCPGAILALANAEPELCVAAFAGDTGAQRRLAPAHLAMRASFPGAIKRLTAERFGTSTAARMG